MAVPVWIMEKYGPTGGISGGGVRMLLAASGLPGPEDVLARECVQNSVDAGLQGQKVLIRFRRVLLTGKSKQEFIERLDLRNEILPRVLQIEGDQELSARALEQDDEPLALLYVEDFNTCGLGGGLTDPRLGHFYRLLFLVGDGDKGVTDEQTGGSYGYGKSVYGSTSNLATIVAHSVFEPSDRTSGTCERLLGCTLLRKHVLGGQDFTGRGWFGLRGEQEWIPVPLVDEQAQRLAIELGFSPRSRTDTGTSILIVGATSNGAPLELESLTRAIETWWWPRLVEDGVSIEIFDGDARLPPPKPKLRTDLKPFIDCYHAITRNLPDNGVRTTRLQAKYNLATGHVAVTTVKPEDGNGDEGLDELRAGQNVPGPWRMALMRSTRMVVEYAAMGTERLPPAVGAFVADADIDKHLKLSEPPAHHIWDPKAGRLSGLTNGREIVESVLQRCKNVLRKYQRALEPEKPKPKEKLSWFDRVLGEALNSRGHGPKPPIDGQRGDVSIHFDRLEAVSDPNGLRLEACLTLQLLERAEAESATIRFAPVVYIQEGEDGRRGERLPAEIANDAGVVIGAGEAPSVTLEVTKSDKRSIFLKSDPYQPDWTVELTVTADPVAIS